jgi:hypothetical protein
MKKHIFVLLVPLLLLAGCEGTGVDPSIKNPAVHVNKFTCKVNGVFWESIPRDRFMFGNVLRVEDDPLGRIYINALNEMNGESINFTFLPTDTSTTVKFLDEDPFSGSYALRCGNYRLDTTKIREITIIEHDKVKLIIKGRFQFSATDKENICGKVTVTDGYFDLRYQ